MLYFTVYIFFFNFIKQYSRGTVASVYTNIEKDLMEGLPYIDDKSYSVPKYHFTKSAANAFAARFFLYKKDYQKVIQYGLQAVPNNDFLSNLRPCSVLPMNKFYNLRSGLHTNQ